jgi:hypothetical protein
LIKNLLEKDTTQTFVINDTVTKNSTSEILVVDRFTATLVEPD